MRDFFFSIQYKVLLFTLIIVIIPILVLGTVSYVKSSEIVQEKVSISNLSTVNQIGSNIEFILKDTYDLSLFFIQDPALRQLLFMEGKETEGEIENKKIAAYNSMAYFLGAKSYIQSIEVYGFNKISLSTKGDIEVSRPKKFDEIVKNNGSKMWSIRTGDRNNMRNSGAVFSLERLIKDINNVNKSLGILSINIKEQALSNIFANKNILKNGYFLLTDENHKIIASLDKTMIGKVFTIQLNSELRSQKEGFFTKKIDGESLLVTYYRIENTNWQLINVVPSHEIIKGNAVIAKVMIVSIVISFIICAIFAFLFSLKVLGPLKHLRLLMRKIEKEDFNVSTQIQSNDEIGLLAKSFNRMSQRLRELIHEVYTVQIKQQEVELKALQAQINPHFLYNTLDTIFWMARMEKAFETSSLVEALSNLFRKVLNSGKETVSMKEEVEHLQYYIIIQQKRFEGRITFNLHVDESLLEYETIKLLLQPLVENAIYHGIEKKGTEGSISVEVLKENDKLIFLIKDDGYGVDLSEIQTLLKNAGANNKGLGIKNVNDRIKLRYGEEYGIEFLTNHPSGTIVKVSQPLHQGSETR